MLRTHTTFYKPRMGAPLYDAVANSTNVGNDIADEPENADLNLLLPVRYIGFDTRRDKGIFREGAKFQITYSFPTAIRHNVFHTARGLFKDVRMTYGADNMSFRQLYDFLCSSFNGDDRFIDTYFRDIFPSSYLGRKFAQFEEYARVTLNEQYEDMYEEALVRKATRAGRPNMSTSDGMLLKAFRLWRSPAVTETLFEFRREVEKDIIARLQNGTMPLMKKLNRSGTMEKRWLLGLDYTHIFYASGQLIKSIQIDVRLPEDAFAA